MLEAAMPNIGRYITYEEVTGEVTSVADAVHLLSQLNIHDVLRMVATLNACFVKPHSSPSSMRQLNGLLVPLLFDKELRSKLENSFFGHDTNVVVFHRQQQLLILRLALIACPDKGGLPWDQNATHLFGKACLMVNDITGTRGQENVLEDERLGLASRILPIYELPSDDEFGSLVGRSDDLWLQIPKDSGPKGEKDYVPWSDRFKDHYGFSLEQFIHGLFIIMARCEVFDPGSDNPHQALLINSKTHLGTSKYPQHVFEAVLRVASCKLSTLRDMQLSEPTQSLRHDFSLLRRYPLLEVEQDVYLCYDRNFLRRFFTDGIFWLIYNILIPQEQSDFQSFFGKVFALYVEKLLKHLYGVDVAGKTHQLRTKLHFTENRGEVCDALIACEDAWIMMETKGSLLTTRAKYSGSGKLLEQDLRDRFVQSRKGDKKGVSQLANSIRKLASGIRTNALELRLEDCKKIYPVIVSYDGTITGLLIPEYLQDELIVALDNVPLHLSVRPLTVMSVSDLEFLTTLKTSPKLNHILATYCHQKFPAESFGAFLSRHYHSQVEVGNSQFFKNFNAICDAVRRYFEE